MVGAEFRSRRAAMGDGLDGARSSRLPRLWPLATYPRAGTSRFADRRDRALSRRHRLADLDRLLSRALLQSKWTTTPAHEPWPLPLRSPSALCCRDRWKSSNGAHVCKPFWVAAGFRLGVASSE